MKIAIHSSKGSFGERWLNYCAEKKIPFKQVDCYQQDIIEQLMDCDALMWHFHHANEKDYLLAKQLLHAVAAHGTKVFPDFNTAWHFDDKLAQKYLFESMGIASVPSYIFYDKQKALQWVETAQYPLVFKLRCGAGSVNVKLVENTRAATKLVYKAFGRGFRHNSLVPFKEIFNRYRKGSVSVGMVLKSAIRLFFPTPFERVHGRENGYIYFQDFIAGNSFDTRVIVIGDKAFAIKRFVRKNDFRASGSGQMSYDKAAIDESLVQHSFEINKKLKMQCVAFDYVIKDSIPLLLEISFGFLAEGYDLCTGYWDEKLAWHDGKFDPYGWMVDNLLAS